MRTDPNVKLTVVPLRPKTMCLAPLLRKEDLCERTDGVSCTHRRQDTSPDRTLPGPLSAVRPAHRSVVTRPYTPGTKVRDESVVDRDTGVRREVRSDVFVSPTGSVGETQT